MSGGASLAAFCQTSQGPLATARGLQWEGLAPVSCREICLFVLMIRASEAHVARLPSLEAAAARTIPMLAGPRVSTYSQSTGDPCGAIEGDITKPVLGDLPTTILSSWDAHGQSTCVTVRVILPHILREAFLLLLAVRIPGHPGERGAARLLGGSTTEKIPMLRGTFVSTIGQSVSNSGVVRVGFSFLFGAPPRACGRQK